MIIKRGMKSVMPSTKRCRLSGSEAEEDEDVENSKKVKLNGYYSMNLVDEFNGGVIPLDGYKSIDCELGDSDSEGDLDGMVEDVDDDGETDLELELEDIGEDMGSDLVPEEACVMFFGYSDNGTQRVKSRVLLIMTAEDILFKDLYRRVGAYFLIVQMKLESNRTRRSIPDDMLVRLTEMEKAINFVV